MFRVSVRFSVRVSAMVILLGNLSRYYLAHSITPCYCLKKHSAP